MSSRKRFKCVDKLKEDVNEDVPFYFEYQNMPEKMECESSNKKTQYDNSFIIGCVIIMIMIIVLLSIPLARCEHKLGNGNLECLKLTYYINENKLNIINTQMMWSFVYYLGISISILVLMEFVCLQFNFAHSPSTLISKISDKLKQIFQYLGKIIAIISSFYARLKLELLWQAISNLFVATAKLMISPFYFLEGYKDIMLQYKYPIMVIVGTATIIVAIVYGIYYYM